MQQQSCLILDPYISSGSVCDALKRHNIESLAFLTDLAISSDEKNKRFPKEKFVKVFGPNMDADELSAFNIVRIIAGQESTLFIADKLANQLCPKYANPVETSICRNDKFMMQERLHQIGLNAIPQVKIDHVHLSEKEKEQINSLGFPLIIKPINGFCSFGVKKCENMTMIESYLNEIIGMQPLIGNTINTVTIQKCIFGDEYFIDTVSLRNHHEITSVFRYQKILYNNNLVCQYADIVNPELPEIIICIDYIKQALSALQLYNGFAHTEFFISENGPILIELNPRISGAFGFPNKLAQLASNRHQAELFAESIIYPDTFIRKYRSLPKLSMHGRILFLHAWEKQTLTHFDDHELMALPSFKDSLLLAQIGDLINPPSNLVDAVAIVLLVHENQDQIIDDYHRVMELEKNHMIF